MLIYRETHSLPPIWRRKVLKNEEKITALYINVLKTLIKRGELPELEDSVLKLAANNISVLGHMWAFRRWMLSTCYSIDQYIEIQTGFILSRCQQKTVS